MGRMTGRLRELAALFLKLGTIGFGGPAVHISAMEDEVVQRRGWLTQERFLDLVGATNLIPGPNSTEMAIHIGYVRAGLLGLIVAGCSFIFPAVLITLGFAWLYVEYGELPQMTPVLYGVKPAVLAIILTAGWRLAKKAITSWQAALIALTVAVCSLCFGRELLLIVLGGVLGMIWLWLVRPTNDVGSKPTTGKAASLLAAFFCILRAKPTYAAPAAAPAIAVATATTVKSFMGLALFFLKVGCVLYGSGYVLFAYLEGTLVNDYQWLTREQLVDAIAVGQLTPGPILSTATFIGYLVFGTSGWAVAGGCIATLCIFLPSFVFVLVVNPIVPRLRKSPVASLFLDAVNAASMGLMAAVTVKLACDTFTQPGARFSVDWSSVTIAAVAIFAAVRFKLSTFWLVVGGASSGYLAWSIGRLLHFV